MSGIVNLRMMGRFGNQLFIYAFGRAYCEKHGFELRTDPWVGEKLFNLPPPHRIAEPFDTTHNEFDPLLEAGPGNIELLGYFQSQAAMIYTRRQVCEWFKWRPEIRASLDRVPPIDGIPAHRRVGDYPGSGYPVVSEESYWDAAKDNSLRWERIVFVTEEQPFTSDAFTGELAFVPDFYRLMAPVMFRGNSCFSWWAGAIGSDAIFSPVIDGLEGGKEHHVQFVLGNHPRLANHEFTTDLHLKES